MSAPRDRVQPRQPTAPKFEFLGNLTNDTVTLKLPFKYKGERKTIYRRAANCCILAAEKIPDGENVPKVGRLMIKHIRSISLLRLSLLR